MRFLLDMGISPRVSHFLSELGHDSAHLFEQGLDRISDNEILAKARAEERILLTHDLDFADLLAASGANLPSVILFRLSDMRAANIQHHLSGVLTDYEADLERGAILSLSDHRVRVRALPITAFATRS